MGQKIRRTQNCWWVKKIGWSGEKLVGVVKKIG
jgi:hypothetical protein